jgi:class 3 adenylate cyclase/tetratricopeptide (TPR) repeat protein
MQCPKCPTENPDGSIFCRECGSNFQHSCPQCGKAILPDDKFCNTCGRNLQAQIKAKPEDRPNEKLTPLPSSDSARKYVTVLFSDMSGYTAMTEKLDPEEVKEIMTKVFGEISKAVSRYEGFIEKFIGDAVMALFGVPQSHEDDPVRAIKAAREIHEIVSSLSPRYEQRIGKPLAMHTGICTGLVVTGEVNLEKGTHGVLGDTINTAARLSGLAKPGEIVIGSDTYHQAEGYFNFEPMEPATVKGKVEPIRPYKVLSPKEDPTKTHRLTGLRAELIGRKVEMAQLQEAVANLGQGKGTIFSIVGDAGTGKSRLIEDFKATINLEEIQWREGHAYAYSQNIPYFPLIDLLSRAWQITEGDSPEQVRKKVETGAGFLFGDRNDLIPYLGSLYSIKYPEIENVGPEYWKARLHEAIQLILANLCKRSSTIICIEDLHWADPSSVELLRNILSDFRYPAVFLCIHRPSFNLFKSHQATTLKSYHEIRLQDLSPTDARNMVESLLKTEAVPDELSKFIQTKIEGNPFYLEEVINSLLETATLIQQADKWLLTKPLSEANIPSTVQGVISARIDRLETETKKILQEASVIGRAFLYEILRRITELKDQIDKSLMGLERLDLIRTHSPQPDLEYIFKHALTQEVVYNGLLKKERQNIHEKIGQVMEELFRDRLDEFYEALAYHYKQGQSLLKAVEYLMKAGEKNINRYSLDEADQYYREAFDLLRSKPDLSMGEKEILIDILNSWFFVHFYQGRFGDLFDLLDEHKEIADSLQDKARTGLFYANLGSSLWNLERNLEAFPFVRKSLEFAEALQNQQLIAYACTQLMFGCAELGRLDEATLYGNRAIELSNSYQTDHMLFLMSRWGIAFTNFYKGIGTPNFKIGQTLLEHGLKMSDARSLVVAHFCTGYGHYIKGDFLSAIETLKKSKEASIDPYYTQLANCYMGFCYCETAQIHEAEKVLLELTKFDEQFGVKIIGTLGRSLLGVVTIFKGDLARGLNILEEMKNLYIRNERKYFIANADYTFGKVYSQLAEGGQNTSFSMVAKNIGFLVRNVPFAAKKAEEYFQAAIQLASEIGAKGLQGRASLDLGHLYKLKGRTDEARKYISDAIQLFEECEADVFLKQAKEALASL